jgi:hypothetical protein
MAISALNLRWLTEPHDLQGMSIPNGNLGLEWLNALNSRKADSLFSW